MNLRMATLLVDFITVGCILGIAVLSWRINKAQIRFNAAVMNLIRDFETRLKRLEGGATDFIPGWKPDPDCKDCQESQRISKFPLATCPKHGPAMGLFIDKG